MIAAYKLNIVGATKRETQSLKGWLPLRSTQLLNRDSRFSQRLPFVDIEHPVDDQARVERPSRRCRAKGCPVNDL